MRKFRLVGAAVLGLVAVVWVNQASARSTRVDQIPNGAVASCNACHVTSGGPRNAFGQMIEADFLTQAGYLGSVVWGPELAALDADGDGATNGQELGDPEGLWGAGDPAPGELAAVTQPGDAASTPPIPTAVQSSTWARVKALLAAEVD